MTIHSTHGSCCWEKPGGLKLDRS